MNASSKKHDLMEQSNLQHPIYPKHKKAMECIVTWKE